MRRCLAFLAAAAAMTPSVASAVCGTLTFSSIAATVVYSGGTGTGYDVFDPVEQAQSVSVTVRKTGGSCSWFVTASQGSGGSFTPRRLASGGNRLNYNLFTSGTLAGILKDLPGATASEVIAGSFGGSGTQTQGITYFYDVPAQQIVAAGTYSDTVQFKLFQGTLAGSNALAQTVNVTHRAVVGATVQLSLGSGAFNPAQTSQTLNFGNLSTGQQLGINLLVRGNNGFDVKMKSTNGSKLMLSAADTVPYTMTVAAAAADLTGTAPVASVTGATGLAGNTFPILVTIGTVSASALTPGTYGDSVAITVTSK